MGLRVVGKVKKVFCDKNGRISGSTATGPGCATPAQLNQRDAGEGGKVMPSSSRSHSAISASAISA
jgi:hypothetical protein